MLAAPLFGQAQFKRDIIDPAAKYYLPLKAKDFAMTNMEMSQLENSTRVSTVWSPEGYDGHVHVLPLLAALLPALFIVAAAAGFLYFVV